MIKTKTLNPILASETLIKLILYGNIVFLIISFFIDISVLLVLILNTLLLLLRQGIRKDADKIVNYNKPIGES